MKIITKITKHLGDMFVAAPTDTQEQGDHEYVLTSLEDRVLYSASPVPVEALDPDAAVNTADPLDGFEVQMAVATLDLMDPIPLDGVAERLILAALGDTEADVPFGDGDTIAELSGPGLTFGEDTDGEFSILRDFNEQGIGSVDLVENGTTAFGTVLQQGDLLFSFVPENGAISNSVQLVDQSGGTFTPDVDDILVHRATATESYFFVLTSLGDLYPDPLPGDFEIQAISVAEDTVSINGTTINSGDLVFVDSKDPTLVKWVGSDGALRVLYDAAEINLAGNAIDGLDLITVSTNAGGQNLAAGTLLLSVQQAATLENVGSLEVQSQDIFSIDLASSSPVARLFYDASDVTDPNVSTPTDSAAANINGLDLSSPTAFVPFPAAQGNPLNLVEDTFHSFSASDFLQDPSAASLRELVITRLPDPAVGRLTLFGTEVTELQSIDAADLSFLLFEPAENATTNFSTFAYRAGFEFGLSEQREVTFNIAPDGEDLQLGLGDGFTRIDGSDQQISFGLGDAQSSQIERLSNGNYAAIWFTNNNLIGSNSIQFEIFDANDNSILAGVNTLTSTAIVNSDPTIAALDDGGFVITWHEESNTGDRNVVAVRVLSDGSYADFFTGAPDNSGGAPVQVIANDVAVDEYAIQVDTLENGFAAAWIEDDGSGRITRGTIFRENDLGVFESVEFEFELPDDGPNQLTPESVAIHGLNDGGFVLAWNASTSNSTQTVNAQFFGPNGEPLGVTIELVETGNFSSTGQLPSITELSNGRVVVGWEEGSGGFREAVVATIDRSSTVQLDSHRVGLATTGDLEPVIEATDDGGFVLVLVSHPAGSESNIEGYRLDENLNRTGASFRVNAPGAGDKLNPSVEFDESTGDILVTWHEEGESGFTGSSAHRARLRQSTSGSFDVPVRLEISRLLPETASELVVSPTLVDIPAGVRVFANRVDNNEQTELSGPVVNLDGFDPSSVFIIADSSAGDLLDIGLTAQVIDGAVNRVVTQRVIVELEEQSDLSIGGHIFNDVQADGLITGDAGFNRVRVLLYQDGIDGFQREVFTDASGYYEFTGLAAETDYFVVVDSRSIGLGEVFAGQRSVAWAQQTYGAAGSIVGNGPAATTLSTDGFLFGGRQVGVSDSIQSDTDDIGRAQHIVHRRIDVMGEAHSDVDFGFSYNVVTNVEDDHTTQIQGSFRQFIQNANSVVGENVMRFVPGVAANETFNVPGVPPAGEAWWSIQVTGLLDAIFDSGTTLDGQAWTPTAAGLVELDLNAFTTVGLSDETVGLDGVSLSAIDAPELELVGSADIDYGVAIRSRVGSDTQDVTIRNFAINGFGDGEEQGAILVVGRNAPNSVLSGIEITDNIIGSGPNDTADVSRDATERFSGITVIAASDGLIARNFIGNQSSHGINIDRANSQDENGWTISDNQIIANAINGNGSFNSDGIRVSGVTDLVISGNLIEQNFGIGIELFGRGPTGDIDALIVNNSILNNGAAVRDAGAGIRISGNEVTITRNLIQGNEDGVRVSHRLLPDNNSVASEGVEITANEFLDNGQSIDLLSLPFEGLSFTEIDTDPANPGFLSADELAPFLTPEEIAIADSDGDGGLSHDEMRAAINLLRNIGDGITENDGGRDAYTGNGGIDFPVIEAGTVNGSTLELEFTSLDPAIERIEIYHSTSVGNGEGEAYLFAIRATDIIFNGTLFVATVDISAIAAFDSNRPITALAIDTSGNTSEFGDNFKINNNAPVSVDGTFSLLEDQSYTFLESDFAFTDADGDPGVAVTVKSLPDPAAGRLLLDGVEVSVDQTIQLSAIDAGRLEFVAAANFNGDVEFDFAVDDGYDSSNVVTMLGSVDSINDAPSAADNTISILEDSERTFTQDDFLFEDAADRPSNSLATITIVSTEGAGTWFNGTTAFDVAPGDPPATVAIADLRFVPDQNFNGSNHAAINFSVQDDGGTRNGGQNSSDPLSTFTLRINVESQSDAPTGDMQIRQINEDQPFEFSNDPAIFGFSDPADGDSFEGIHIDSIFGGTLTLIDGINPDIPVTAGSFVVANQLDFLVFTPDENLNGTDAASFFFGVDDTGSTTNGGIDSDQTFRKFQFDIDTVNDAPIVVVPQETITIREDEDLVLSEADFGFSDPADIGANSLGELVITSVTGSGLTLSGVALFDGQVIDQADISSIEFTPEANTFGEDVVVLNFRLRDDGGDANGGVDLSEEATLRFDVTSVSDAPSGTNNTVFTSEDIDYVFRAEDFGFTDVADLSNGDRDDFLSITITDLATTGGVLEFNDLPVVDGQTILISEIANLKYIPDADQHGFRIFEFRFQVTDTGSSSPDGDNTDASPNLIRINVQSVNDAPTATPVAVEVDEDSSVSLARANFGFDDSRDTPENDFSAIRIVDIHGSGTFVLGSSVLAAGDEVSAADIATIVFTPESNEFGDNYASIDFRVVDDGGQARGGVDVSTIATLEINVRPVSDAPQGESNRVEVNEGSSVPFKAEDFGFSDDQDFGQSDIDSFDSIVITQLPANGTLTFNSVPVFDGQTVDVSLLPNLVFTPEASASGPGYASFGFQVVDSGTTNPVGENTDAVVRIITIDVTPVNEAPSGTDNTITINEDSPYEIREEDFGFTDATDGDDFLEVRIDGFSGSGQLLLDGQPIANGTIVPVGMINSLVYMPAENENGLGLATVSFSVIDDGRVDSGGSNTAVTSSVLTFDVRSVNDAPEGRDNRLSVTEDGELPFTAADFGFSDFADGDNFGELIITRIGGLGTLTLDSVEVVPGDRVTVGELSDLRFTPEANQSGDDYASFSFRVIDDGGNDFGGVSVSDENFVIVIDVEPVNDAPRSEDRVVRFLEDENYSFSVDDFVFRDPLDTGGSLQEVTIETLSRPGVLFLDGDAVNAGDVISAGDIDKLQLVPLANENGDNYFTLQFRVVDNGGGDDTSGLHELVAHVTPVNDAPTAEPQSRTISEDTPFRFSASDFGFADAIDGDNFMGIEIVDVPANGQLILEGSVVLPGQRMSMLRLAGLEFVPESNATGPMSDQFTFRVLDSGGVGNGGVNISESQTFSFDVIPVNDAPVSLDSTVEVAEDETRQFTASDFGFRDIESDRLSAVVINTTPAAGQLTFNGNVVTAGLSIPVGQLSQLRFTPEANEFGDNYTGFEFSVIDSNANPLTSSSSSFLQIDVTPVNDAPELVVVDVQVEENSILFAFDADAIDVENDPLTFSLNGNDADNSLFEIDESTGVVSFIDQPDFFNPLDDGMDNVYRVAVTVTDAAGLTDREFVLVTVTESNQAPFISTTQLSQFENETPGLVIETGGRENLTLTFELVGSNNDNDLFVLDTDSGQLMFIEAPNFEAGDVALVVDVRVTDSEGLSATQRIDVSVQDVAETIPLSDVILKRDLDTVVDLDVFTAEESRQLALEAEATFRIVEGPRKGTVSVNENGIVEYTPLFDEIILDSFVIEVDSGGETSRKTVTVKSKSLLSTTPNQNSDDENQPNNIANGPDPQEGPVQEPVQVSTAEVSGVTNLSSLLLAAANSNEFGADTLSNDFSGQEVGEESNLAVFGFDYSTYVYSRSVDTELLTEQLVTGLVRSGRAVLENALEDTFLSASFWQQMNSAEQEYLFDSFESTVATTITAGAIGVTSVVVSFALRAMLIGISLTAVSSSQWWVTSFDISTIVESEDNESIESLVDGA